MTFTLRPLAARLSLLLFAIVMGLLLASEGRAAVFASFDSTRHDRFIAGAPNSNFIITQAGFTEADISGMFGNSIMITPQHLLTAAHTVTGTGDYTATFRGADGVMRSYTSTDLPGNAHFRTLQTTYDPGTGTTTIGSDARIYRLDAPIPAADQVSVFGILDATPAEIFNQEFFLTGAASQAGKNKIDGTTIVEMGPLVRPSHAIGFDFDTLANGGTGAVPLDEAALALGDSGKQALMQVGNQLAIIGAHYGVDDTDGMQPANGGNNLSFSTYLTPYLDQIESFVAEDGYTINRISINSVPEPTTGGLVIIGATVLIARRRRKQ